MLQSCWFFFFFVWLFVLKTVTTLWLHGGMSKPATGWFCFVLLPYSTRCWTHINLKKRKKKKKKFWSKQIQIHSVYHGKSPSGFNQTVIFVFHSPHVLLIVSMPCLNAPTQSPHSCQSQMNRTHPELVSVEKCVNVWGSKLHRHVFIFIFSLSFVLKCEVWIWVQR